MSTLALNRLLDYILALSLTDNNKDWLASKIIESKTSKTVSPPEELCNRKYSARINKLLSIPKCEIEAEDISNDPRLQSILER